ncbi:ABC transporter permease [Bauldia litoralis]|uniref:ABC transporter permease n=1 Tax=Bauldia litoralis TaxID=665467 RepID=UPI00326549F7
MSASAETVAARRSVTGLLWRTFSGRVGAVIVIFFVLMAVTAPLLAPYDPLSSDWGAVLQPPSLAHLLGTDELGRDVLSRLLWGAQSSMFAAVGSVAVALAVGVPLGMTAGYFGGVADIVISRLTDTLLAVPGIMLAIALALFLGGSLVNATLAIAVAAVPAFIRLSRARTLQVRAEPYIEAARSVGVANTRLLFVHIFPNLMPPIIVQATLAMAVAVIAEASLSFLGLGRPPPAPSWGSMLTVGKDYIATASWLSIWPGLCIFLVTVGFSLLGDGLRQSLERR